MELVTAELPMFALTFVKNRRPEKSSIYQSLRHRLPAQSALGTFRRSRPYHTNTPAYHPLPAKHAIPNPSCGSENGVVVGTGPCPGRRHLSRCTRMGKEDILLLSLLPVEDASSPGVQCHGVLGWPTASKKGNFGGLHVGQHWSSGYAQNSRERQIAVLKLVTAERGARERYCTCGNSSAEEWMSKGARASERGLL
jgi:hypothetical protein